MSFLIIKDASAERHRGGTEDLPGFKNLTGLSLPSPFRHSHCQRLHSATLLYRNVEIQAIAEKSL